MSTHKVSLNPKSLLSAISDNLNLHFFTKPRDQAKQLYNAINSDTSTSFMRIDMGDNGEVRCNLSMDHSLYVGKLNYGKFRKNLSIMMEAIKERIDQDAPITATTSRTGEILFNIPGVLNEDNQTNVMVCSFQPMGAGLAAVRLIFADPDKYSDQT